MEFDLSRVYTAVNADELKVGSRCIFANNIDSLKCKVKEGNDIRPIVQILDNAYERRFKTNCAREYPFAYFVSEPNSLNWTDLKVGDIIVTRRRVVEVDKSDITRMHVRMNSIINDSVFDEWITDEDLASNWEKEEPANRFQNTNLNEHIKVKLTERGKQIYNDYYNGTMVVDYDEDGYATFQMWDFMRIFGGHMNIASELVCETNVMIEVKE